MHFEPNALYHIYNRSNEKVFYSRDNYLFFLKKLNDHIRPICPILAWVLMPNHFHLLVEATNESCVSTLEQHRPATQQLSQNIGSVLSGYTQAINKQAGRRGKLFSHNTKAKMLNLAHDFQRSRNQHADNRPDYATTCFLYIHQNPVTAGLVDNLRDWEFSSLGTIPVLGTEN